MKINFSKTMLTKSAQFFAFVAALSWWTSSSFLFGEPKCPKSLQK